MKRRSFTRGIFPIIVLAWSCLVAIATSQAGADQPGRAALSDNAHLVVWRAADFGTIQYLDISIDGVRVSTLGYGQGYQALVRPGTHMISVNSASSGYGRTHITHHRVNLERGQTYIFTALWETADRVALNTSDDANRRSNGRWF